MNDIVPDAASVGVRKLRVFTTGPRDFVANVGIQQSKINFPEDFVVGSRHNCIKWAN
jgi:hypothetical protein